MDLGLSKSHLQRRGLRSLYDSTTFFGGESGHDFGFIAHPNERIRGPA